jgi:phage-related holin
VIPHSCTVIVFVVSYLFGLVRTTVEILLVSNNP